MNMKRNLGGSDGIRMGRAEFELGHHAGHHEGLDENNGEEGVWGGIRRVKMWTAGLG